MASLDGMLNLYTRSVSGKNEALLQALLTKASPPTFDRAGELPMLYEHFGLKADGAYLRSRIEEKILDEVQEALTPETGDQLFLPEFQKIVELRRVADGADLEKAVTALSVIKDATRDIGWRISPLSDEARWIKALSLVNDYLHLQGGDRSEQINWEVSELAFAIRRLRACGYPIIIKEGQRILAIQEAPIAKKIDNLVKDIGGQFLAKIIFSKLTELFDRAQGRYHITRTPSVTGYSPSKRIIPYGYLLALCVKHWQRFPDSRYEDRCEDLFEMATVFAMCYDVTPQLIYKIILRDRTNIVELITSVTAWDTLYQFQQFDPRWVSMLISGLFDWVPRCVWNDVFGVNVEEIMNVVDAIMFDSTVGPVSLSVDRVAAQTGISVAIVERVLDILCASPSIRMNANYKEPLNLHERLDHWKYPLLRSGKTYWLMDRVFAAPAFYERVADSFRLNTEMRVDEEIGKAFERFVCRLLKNKGIDVYSGRYRASSGLGECDLVLETSEYILLIELKKKALTLAARSARPANVVLDMVDALVAPHVQCGNHELALLTDGEIKFEDGRVLKLRQRRIEKIAISPLDFGGLHTRDVAIQLLRCIAGGELHLEGVDIERVKKANRMCRKLGEQALKLSEVGSQDIDNPFFNCWFLALPFFLHVIEDARSADDLLRELNKVRFISMGTLDTGFEYSIARNRQGA